MNTKILGATLIPAADGMRYFTVIASVANEGTLKVFHVQATDGMHSFSVVAKRDQSESLEFVVSVEGIHTETSSLTLPGEGIVCAETVLDQEDVFGPCDLSTPAVRQA